MKPPLGVKPKWVHDQDRAFDLMRALVAYSDHYPIPRDDQTQKLMASWWDELRDIIRVTGL